jgi:hypothetical protein
MSRLAVSKLNPFGLPDSETASRLLSLLLFQKILQPGLQNVILYKDNQRMKA